MYSTLVVICKGFTTAAWKFSSKSSFRLCFLSFPFPNPPSVCCVSVSKARAKPPTETPHFLAVTARLCMYYQGRLNGRCFGVLSDLNAKYCYLTLSL